MEEVPTDLTYALLTQMYKVQNAIVHREKSYADVCKEAEISAASQPIAFHSECRNFWNDCIEITRRILLQVEINLYNGIPLCKMIAIIDERVQRD